MSDPSDDCCSSYFTGKGNALVHSAIEFCRGMPAVPYLTSYLGNHILRNRLPFLSDEKLLDSIQNYGFDALITNRPPFEVEGTVCEALLVL